MPSPLDELMAKHPSLSITERGMIRCGLTGHEMPPCIDTLQDYLGGLKYATASGKYQHIEDLIAELAPCPSLRARHPACYQFFRELFQYHPHAERKRVDKIKDIALNGAFDTPGGPVFRIIYSRWKSDLISWRKCMKGYEHVSASTPSVVRGSE